MLGRVVVDENVSPSEESLERVETFRSVHVQRYPPLAGVVVEEQRAAFGVRDPLFGKGPHWRDGSPPRGSTLITSAPLSASSLLQ